MDGLLLDDSLLMYDVLSIEVIGNLIEEHKKSNNYNILFSLVVFEQWLRQY